MSDVNKNDNASSSSSDSEEEQPVEEFNQTLEIMPTQENYSQEAFNETIQIVPTQFSSQFADDLSQNEPDAGSECENEQDGNASSSDSENEPTQNNVDEEQQNDEILDTPLSPNNLSEDDDASRGIEFDNDDSKQDYGEEENENQEIKTTTDYALDADSFQDNAVDADDESRDSSDDEQNDKMQAPDNLNESNSQHIFADEDSRSNQETDLKEVDEYNPEEVSIKQDIKFESSSEVQANSHNEAHYNPEEPGYDATYYPSIREEDRENEITFVSGDEENRVFDHQPDVLDQSGGQNDQPGEPAPALENDINDIFGSSDSEEEFEGFGEEELIGKEAETIQSEVPSRAPSEDEDDTISDFDKMLLKKKEEMSKRRRKRKDVDIINDQDDKIVKMISAMKEAADRDRMLNIEGKVALEKLKLLKSVLTELKKCHLQVAFIDNGVLVSIAEWLTPLPDKSLPHLEIRTTLLKVLESFPELDSATLKESSIGKYVMLLYKHPKEIRENRIRAGKLINKWARPIFGLQSDFQSMTREDREQRDIEKMRNRKRKREEKKEDDDEDAPKGPGEAGFILRALVPMPSVKDYVVRPKSGVGSQDYDEDDEESGLSAGGKVAPARSKGPPKTRIDKYVNMERERKKKLNNTHAIKLNLCGNKGG